MRWPLNSAVRPRLSSDANFSPWWIAIRKQLGAFSRTNCRTSKPRDLEGVARYRRGQAALAEFAGRYRRPAAFEYPMGFYTDEIVIWQLGEFKDARAVEGLQRITVVSRHHITGLLHAVLPSHRSSCNVTVP